MSDHSIHVFVEPEGVFAEFRCDAPDGADCRLGCGEQCAAWLDGDPCGHDRTRDEGFCLPITWLREEADWTETFGGERAEVRSGAIAVDWDPLCGAWLWRFADRAEPRTLELPIHRTEAGWPNCATCDGGGCPDCTDPA